MTPEAGTPPLDDVATRLAGDGFAVTPGFLSPSECRALESEIERLESQGRLDQAGVGQGKEHRVRQEVRSDLIFWLDETSLPPAVAVAWAKLEALRTTLNRTLFLGLRRFEGHLTCYPVGARYDRHVDNFAGRSTRVVSSIVYLSADWQSTDGGVLRLYGKGDPVVPVRDVLPAEGTLVCFLSAEIPHEVLTTRRPRRSLTGWFRTD